MSDKKESPSPPSAEEVKASRHRSPNHPYFGLQKAVERAKQIYDRYKRATVPIHLVHEIWEYKPHSGAGNQAVAALKTYGLLDVEGEGKERKVRLTDPASRIVMGSPDRNELLKKAAVAPAIHNELWEKYRAEEHFPDDTLIRHYLRWDREGGTFNDETVDGFIDNFRGSLRFSGLLSDGIIEQEAGSDVGKTPEPIAPPRPTPAQIGNFVQWTSAGVDMFETPRRVRWLSDDGKFLAVEGSQTGISVSEVTVVSQTMETTRQPHPTPPAVPPEIRLNSFGLTRTVRADKEEGEWNGPSLRLTLAKGNAIEIRMKSPVTQKEFERIKKMIDLSEDSFLLHDEDDEVVN